MKCGDWGPISKGIKRKDGREHRNNRSRQIISHEGHNTDHEGFINMTESHKPLPGGHKGQTENQIMSPQNIGHKGFVNTTLTHTSLHEGQSDSNCVSYDIFRGEGPSRDCPCACVCPCVRACVRVSVIKNLKCIKISCICSLFSIKHVT